MDVRDGVGRWRCGGGDREVQRRRWSGWRRGQRGTEVEGGGGGEEAGRYRVEVGRWRRGQRGTGWRWGGGGEEAGRYRGGGGVGGGGDREVQRWRGEVEVRRLGGTG